MSKANTCKNLRKGSLRTGAWIEGDQHWFMIIVISAAFIRAFDYITGDDPLNRVNQVAEMAMPLSCWAYVLVVGAFTIIYGYFSKRHVIVFIGHLILGCCYASMALGVLFSFTPRVFDMFVDLLSYIHSDHSNASEHFDLWTLDGIRHAGPILTVAMVHLFTAYRMGYTPLEKSHEKPMGIISGGTGGTDG